MDDENKVNLDASVQDTDTSADSDTNDTSNDADTRYLNQKLRAEKAEKEKKELESEIARLKSTKSEVKSQTVKGDITNDRGENYLISVFGSKGLEYDEMNTYLDKARKIAQVEGIDITKVLETDYFKSFDKTFQTEKKNALATMGASKGSGSPVTKKNLQTPGLSDAEFKQMLKEKVLGQ